MPVLAPRRWSADDVRALPEEPGKRFECVDGELLVTPSPKRPHQWVSGDLWRLLEDFARAAGVGTAVMAPSDVELDPFSLVQPDIYVIPLVDGRRPVRDEDVGAPLLFVEVLSPSTARNDRLVKRQRYQRQGIEYWIVDLDARLVERWLPDATRPEVLIESIVWHPTGTTSSLTIELPSLFEATLGPL